VSGHACRHLFIPRDDPVADQLGLGAAALRYAALGLAVFPLQPGGKVPLQGSGGFLDATTGSAQIRAWWTGAPGRNIGIATGQRSHLLIIDLDRKGGKDGPVEFARWQAANSLALPLVPYVTTPSDGGHLWIRLPAGRTVPSRNGVLPGVDIKADGGYVVAPPSGVKVPAFRQPGEPRQGPVFLPYTWHGCPCGAPEAPAALLDALDGLRGWAGGLFMGGRGNPGGDLPPTEELARTGLMPGSRNKQMHDLACRLWRVHGLDGRAAVEATCYAVWQATMQGTDPFPRSEVPGRIESARRFIAEQDKRECLAAEQFRAFLESRRQAS
jgi:hypothetical protein